MNIAQSVIVVTAAGCPMGKAISLHFASLGAKLALVDIEASRLAQVQQACLCAGGDSDTFLLTAQDETSIAQLIRDIDHRFGAIDVLINYWQNAELPSLLEPTSVDRFCRSMIEGATPFFIFGKHTASYMREHHSEGVIINLAASYLNPDQPANSSSKAMISGLTQSWAKELAEFNIRVGGVVPLCLERQPCQTDCTLSLPMQYEIVRCAEYIVANDYFNGRMIEAEAG
ncbi:SDR family oxidoreductase [Photobacterium sp. MCCC 1A19761]|uniref:SDR family oxidoreductase n=1 Tax=Photobacterium sp. MCCC 1A19761 TaxID=3115000 RepID=UPI00307E8A2A